jgi:glycosyltransferase involved in cell wall biosynthesis
MSLMREQHKNISMLVRAVAKLSGTRQDFELVLAGDGPDREVLEQRVREAGLLDSAIRFVGAVPTNAVAEFYAGACFSVVSSVVETFCMAAAESIASGRPVVSTRCGGPEDFISDEVGRLVANDDAEEMAVALDWMLDHYTDFQPARVHEHAASLFTADRVVRQLDAVYCAVLHRRQGAC